MIRTKAMQSFYEWETSIQTGLVPKQEEKHSAGRMNINGFII